MKKVMLFICSCLFFVNVKAQKLNSGDLDMLSGKWAGELTYLDYTSNQQESIRSFLTVVKKRNSLYRFSYSYPGESGRDGVDNFRVSEDGTAINKMKIVEYAKIPGGGFKLVLEEKGKDGNNHRPAVFRHIVERSGEKLVLTKMVKFNGEDEFFQRNRYVFNRN
ncbi:MAG: hypothetical protein WBO39_15610 [Ferruginibacter sp.]